QPFAALHAFEQEARLERGQLGERRYRRVQVPCDVEWRFQENFPVSVPSDNTKPITRRAGDGLWDGVLEAVLRLAHDAQHPAPSGVGPPPALRGVGRLHWGSMASRFRPRQVAAGVAGSARPVARIAAVMSAPAGAWNARSPNCGRM